MQNEKTFKINMNILDKYMKRLTWIYKTNIWKDNMNISL